MSIINSDVVTRLMAGKSLWVGVFPPRSDMADGSGLLDRDTDFRLPSPYHQAFDLVFLAEADLGTIKQWPLVLDEAMRAVKPGGVLVVRLVQSEFLSVFKLANFIQKWTAGAFRLLDQVHEDGRYLLTVQLTHARRRVAGASSFSFGLITDGRKPDSVAAFVQSILTLRRPGKGIDPEVLICGPEQTIDDLGDLASHVQLVPQPEQFHASGWITRKKNLLVQAASAENLLIAHDRYTVPEDFLERLAEFGGDFDVLVPRQVTLDGGAVPDWVMISEDLNWSTPGWMEFGDYHPYAFVNGGVMIAKRAVLERTPWNELLMWGQAEDVELSRRFEDAGFVPRPSRATVLVTETPRAGFSEGFEKLVWEADHYPVTERPQWPGSKATGASAIAVSPSPRLEMEVTVDLKGRAPSDVARTSGVVFGSEWRAGPDGLTWAGQGRATFSIKAQDVADDMLLELHAAPGASGVSDVRIGADVCPAYGAEAGRTHVLIAKRPSSVGNIIHVSFSGGGEGGVVLSALGLSKNLKGRSPEAGTQSKVGGGRRLLSTLLGGGSVRDAGGRARASKVVRN